MYNHTRDYLTKNCGVARCLDGKRIPAYHTRCDMSVSGTRVLLLLCLNAFVSAPLSAAHPLLKEYERALLNHHQPTANLPLASTYEVRIPYDDNGITSWGNHFFLILFYLPASDFQPYECASSDAIAKPRSDGSSCASSHKSSSFTQ